MNAFRIRELRTALTEALWLHPGFRFGVGIMWLQFGLLKKWSVAATDSVAVLEISYEFRFIHIVSHHRRVKNVKKFKKDKNVFVRPVKFL